MIPPTLTDTRYVREVPERTGADGAILYPAQRQRNKQNDNDRVEDHRGENRALGRSKIHNV